MQDFDSRYRAVSSRDARFDGWFVTGVHSTGIYCRPSCPATTPKPSNVVFYRTAAAAQAAGLRACKRCRPDATPGSPEWNLREDLVARAMRLIADGTIDRDGVAGLARRLHLSERHLHRQLVDELGAGPQALARAERARAARALIETTELPFTSVAFSSGFASIRQFNDTVRRVFGSTPTELRRRAQNGDRARGAGITLRLSYRPPFDWRGLLDFFAARCVDGLEEIDGATYRRALRLPHAPGVAELSLGAGHVSCTLQLEDLRDLVAAVQRCRLLLDLDADPVAIDESLRRDAALAPLVDGSPGRRVPGTVDPFELACRAVLGQQVSVAAARTLAARLVRLAGKPLTAPVGRVTHLFPDPEAVAGTDLSEIGLPATRRRTLNALADAVARGDVVLGPGADRREAVRSLRTIPGIGPWTASYVAMRALRDPDAFPAGDLGIVKAIRRLGVSDAASEQWRPWRAYAAQHLWSSLASGQP